MAQQPLLRTPIEHAPLSEVTARVVYQIVRLDWKRNPHLYATSVPMRLLELSNFYRDNGFPYLKFALVSLGVHIVQGGTAGSWRDGYPRLNGLRAKHKQRIPLTRK